MKYRDRILSTSLLTLALAAPTVLPGAAPAEARVDKKDKAEPQYVRQNDRNDPRYGDDWDDWNDDWDDDDMGQRFEGMDTNRDGRVTRSEWRGNARSFDNQDWNRDGVLSGNELRPGAGRETRSWNDTWNERFERLDRNNDNYISMAEWTRDARMFDRLDLNNDNRVSRSELLNLARQRQSTWDQRFTQMDVNRDGRLSQREWQGDRDTFERLDRNNDGYVARTEIVSRDFDRDDDENTTWDQRFSQMDTNRDGRLSQREWQRDRDTFELLDRNDDGYVTRTEMANRDFDQSRTEPYPRNEERFQQFDRNNDRRLSRSEWTGSRDLFDRLDSNNDGYLNVREWMGW
jgi:Ca2+-binding EF-hand superfamily protein